MMAKKKTPRLDLGFGFRLPQPLPDPLCEDLEVAGHLAAWAARAWGAEVKAANARLIDDPRPPDAAALRALLTPAVLDTGTFAYSDAVRDALPTKEQRAYDRATRKAEPARKKRRFFVERVLTALAAHPDTEMRRVEIALGTGDVKVREAAAASVISAAGPSPSALEALAALCREPEPLLIRQGATAAFRLDPDGAWDRLADLRPSPSVDPQRSHAMLDGLPATGTPDRRWRTLVLDLLESSDSYHREKALYWIERLGLAPDAGGPVVRSVEHGLSRGSFISPKALDVLAELGAACALPVFVRALDLRHSHYGKPIEGIAVIGDPAAVPALERWMAGHPTYARAAEVRDALLADGPAAPGQIAALEARAASLGDDLRVPSAPPVPAPLPERAVPVVEPLETQRAALAKELRGMGLGGEAVVAALAFVRGAIRLVAIRAGDDDPPAAGASRLGGAPDLPADVAWPTHRERPLSFVAQLDLVALAPMDADGRLPSGGLLSFFVDDDYDGIDEYLSVCRVLYTPSGVAVAVAETPEGAMVYRECRVHAVPELQLPAPSHPGVAAALTDEDRERYTAGWGAAAADHQVLGYRGRDWDAGQPDDVLLLLQLVSDPHPGMTWGDEDHVYFYVRADRLADADFTSVSSGYGE